MLHLVCSLKMKFLGSRNEFSKARFVSYYKVTMNLEFYSHSQVELALNNNC